MSQPEELAALQHSDWLESLTDEEFRQHLISITHDPETDI